MVNIGEVPFDQFELFSPFLFFALQRKVRKPESGEKPKVKNLVTQVIKNN